MLYSIFVQFQFSSQLVSFCSRLVFIFSIWSSFCSPFGLHFALHLVFILLSIWSSFVLYLVFILFSIWSSFCSLFCLHFALFCSSFYFQFRLRLVSIEHFKCDRRSSTNWRRFYLSAAMLLIKVKEALFISWAENNIGVNIVVYLLCSLNERCSLAWNILLCSLAWNILLCSLAWNIRAEVYIPRATLFFLLLYFFFIALHFGCGCAARLYFNYDDIIHDQQGR